MLLETAASWHAKLRDALAIVEDTGRSQASVLTEDQRDALVAKIEAARCAHEPSAGGRHDLVMTS